MQSTSIGFRAKIKRNYNSFVYKILIKDASNFKYDSIPMIYLAENELLLLLSVRIIIFELFYRHFQLKNAALFNSWKIVSLSLQSGFTAEVAIHRVYACYRVTDNFCLYQQY